MDSLVEEKKEKRKRIWEIDFFRGLAIILMILDHLCYDLAMFPNFFATSSYNEIFLNLSDFAFKVNNSFTRYVFHCIFVAVFFLISGISSSFSKNNLKRGFLILGACCVLDLITYLIYFISNKGIDVRMIFNVLMPLGIGTLILSFLKKIPYNKYICLILGSVIIILGFIFNQFAQVDVENFYDEISFEIIPSILISKAGFGSDCFGIVPYIGFIFIGSFLGDTLYKDKKSKLAKLDGKWNKCFCFVGRNSIWFYLFHQVVLSIIVGLICLCVGYRF